jgi:hypothetical protein
MLAVVALVAPRVADATEDRPIVVSVTAGLRTFNDDLGLQDAFAYGARVDMAFSSRVGMIFDFVDAQPVLLTDYATATVPALRALFRVNILEGKYRPYALAGGGGMLIQYPDDVSTGAATVTFGAGLEGRFGKQARVFVEGTADIFWAEPYTSPAGPGYPGIQVSPRQTESAGTICAGAGLEF